MNQLRHFYADDKTFLTKPSSLPNVKQNGVIIHQQNAKNYTKHNGLRLSASAAVLRIQDFLLADRAARSMIGYWYDMIMSTVCLSVCL